MYRYNRTMYRCTRIIQCVRRNARHTVTMSAAQCTIQSDFWAEWLCLRRNVQYKSGCVCGAMYDTQWLCLQHNVHIRTLRCPAPLPCIMYIYRNTHIPVQYVSRHHCYVCTQMYPYNVYPHKNICTQMYISIIRGHYKSRIFFYIYVRTHSNHPAHNLACPSAIRVCIVATVYHYRLYICELLHTSVIRHSKPTLYRYIANHEYFLTRGGGLGSRPKKMYGERLGDGVEYHLMKPTPRR